MHVVTGATGLVGSALVLELLRRTDADVACLVRPGRSDASTRLTAALGAAARAFGHGEAFDADIRHRCVAVAADVDLPLCGVDPARFPAGATEFWHCAADQRYEERHWEGLQRTNVLGTRHAVDLATTLGCLSFNHFSTAYVAGRRYGTVRERAVTDPLHNNRYEESKIAAEWVVLAADGLVKRILRPGIVIGHSVTHALVGGHSGMYGIHRQLVQVERMLSMLGDPAVRTRPLRLRADRATPVDLAPVDLVAADAVSLSRSGHAGVFHLTHPTGIRLGDGLDLMFDVAGLPRPHYTYSDAGFAPADREFDRKIDFFRSYLTGAKTFDRTRLLAAVPAPAVSSWHLDLAVLREFQVWYQTHATSLRTVPSLSR
ncbi:SDR family oxidoreductase [Kutzneria kofuensis]|uniref:Thioester reductase-like protein n=1 Tax=Kutzneria kofuensis TaxID=103725 RepID=A0A7W9NJI8_9PSEU|nr:SDR family oxidoreductase [Kutzneria kofuensis]MBB5895010.1 thioester reductase-like protein [Kutzneria kofuensis]